MTMPNTKEAEQAAESLFPLPENPDARSLTNRDVVINCRSAFKGGYNYALSPLEQSENKEEWVSCKDRLPEDSGTVLVSDDETDVVCTGYYNTQINGWCPDIEIDVTHWKPLPSPPCKH